MFTAQAMLTSVAFFHPALKAMTQVIFDYTRQDAKGGSCVSQAWARTPEPLSQQQRSQIKSRAAELLKAHAQLEPVPAIIVVFKIASLARHPPVWRRRIE